MKIIDFIQKNNNRIDIPNVGREDLPQFFKDMGFKVGAEIGVERGLFSESICKKGLKLYAIDPWIAYKKRNHISQNEFDHIYEEAKKRLKSYDCTIIRKTSLDAAKDFEDESLDFVYIDGAHDFKNVTDDINIWSKKIRKGGVISGHDYILIERRNDIVEVKRAVDAYVSKNKINPWYVLGRKEKIDGEIRDKQRSWMWIKS
jgi:hypothetical protein